MNHFSNGSANSTQEQLVGTISRCKNTKVVMYRNSLIGHISVYDILDVT